MGKKRKARTVDEMTSSEILSILNRINRNLKPCSYLPLEAALGRKLDWRFQKVCRPYHKLFAEDAVEDLFMDFGKSHLLSSHAIIRSDYFIGISDSSTCVRGFTPDGNEQYCKVSWDSARRQSGILQIEDFTCRFSRTIRHSTGWAAVISDDSGDLLVASHRHWLEIVRIVPNMALLVAFIWRIVAEDAEIVPSKW